MGCHAIEQCENNKNGGDVKRVSRVTVKLADEENAIAARKRSQTSRSTVHMTMPSQEAEEALVRYLDECVTEATNDDFSRTRCEACSSSRSMYCFDCLRLLVPRERWPEPVRDGRLRLPFDVDIILDDRRSSATGVQLKTILASMLAQEEEEEVHSAKPIRTRGACHLYDIDRDEEIPNYSEAKDGETFLLFPGPTSQAFSTIVDTTGTTRVKRLVVLDCKWSRSSIRFHPSIADLPRVHLDRVPKHSFYWRWHNAGEGMLSTIEAIYYSAWEVATVCPDFSKDDRANLVHLLWLFGLQREIIQSRYKEGKVKCFKQEPSVPFLEASKEFNRSLRSKQKLKRKQEKLGTAANSDIGIS